MSNQHGYGPPPGGGGYGPPGGGWGPPQGPPQGPPGGPPGGGGYGPPPGGGGYGPPPGGGGYGPPPGGGGYGPPGGGYGPQQGWGPGQSFGGPPGGQWRGPPRTPQPASPGCGPIVLGGILTLAFLGAWAALSHQGIGTAAVTSLFLAGGVWLLVWGIARMAKKTLPVAAHIGILAGVAILFTLAGPSVGRSVMESRERTMFAELSEEGSPAYLWTGKYEVQIPENYRRKEWRLEWMNSRIREGKTEKSAGKLRTIANECADHDESELLEPAREDAISALKEMYQTGKKQLLAPRAGGSGEFPVDDALRQAFGVVLDDLARAKTADVHVAFENSAELEPPKGFAEVIKEVRSEPDVVRAFPKRDAPVIVAGNAFSPSFDSRRRATFITAMSGSFGTAFDGQLLTLVPLEKGASRKGKIVIDVNSRLFRDPDVFLYTNSETGVKKLVGLLFSFQVEWDFKLLGRDGKVLFTAPKAVSKPSDAKFDTDPKDPDWAPYSIMMDSAYYNYSREVTGRFGLTPPARKDFFVYSGAAPAATP